MKCSGGWHGADQEARGRSAPGTGLAEGHQPWTQRIAERGSLEIQAYDEAVLSRAGSRMGGVGRAAALRRRADAWSCRRMPTRRSLSWIAAGTPPICFGFGSMRVDICRRHARHDRRGLRTVRRAGVDLRRRE